MSFVWWDAWLTLHDVNDTHGPTARLRTCYIDKNMPTYVYIDRYIHTHMHTHTYIQRTSRVATSVLSGRLVLAKVQADQKKRIITGSEYSSPPPSQTRFCRKATPLACKRNTLDKKTSLNISFGTRGSIIFIKFRIFGKFLICFRKFDWKSDTRHYFLEFGAKSGKNSSKIRRKKCKIRSVCDWINEYSLIQSRKSFGDFWRTNWDWRTVQRSALCRSRRELSNRS